MNTQRDGLIQAIEGEADRAPSAAVSRLVEEVRRRHGEAVVAVLFYGSCRRDGDCVNGIADFYVLVESYRAAHGRALPALLNALLPPNVYYLESRFEEHVVRVKYAIVSLASFLRGASPSGFHPWIWGRFSQPCSLVYARDAAAREAVLGALADAVETMIGETAPLMAGTVDTETLWCRALAESYRTELRVEDARRAKELYAQSASYYEKVTEIVVESGGAPGLELRHDGGLQLVAAPRQAARRRAGRRWLGRRMLGKLLSLPRLVKGLFTFEGGVDYALWKIERHTGTPVVLTPWQRRHPLLAAPGVLWRLYRRRLLR